MSEVLFSYCRSVLASAVLTVLLFGGAESASAATVADVPPDVAAAFDGAVEWIVEDAESYPDVEEAAAFAHATGIDDITQVFTFTRDYLFGEPFDNPVEPNGEWFAAVLSGKEIIGFVRVWTPTDGVSELAGYSGQVDIGSALDRVGGGTFVIEPRTDEAFVINGDTIEALNESATVELPFPSSLVDFQQVISRRILAAHEAGEGVEAPVGGGGEVEDRRPWWYGDNAWLVLGIGALAVGLVLLLVFLRRRTAGAR